MDRLACVDLPAFPLQLLCRRHPEWRELPVAVISEDKPQGVLLWVNDKARAARILPGQRYAQALSLHADLRGGVVSPAEIEEAVAATCEMLRRYSPHIEAYAEQPGVFWLDASGLERLYQSIRRWLATMDRDLRELGWETSLVLGWSRFATYAIARAQRRGVSMFDNPESERAAANDVPLECLDLAPRLRDSLRRLGITTVGQFARLPPGGTLTRFGKEVKALHALAAGDGWDPLRPKPPPDPVIEHILFDDPVADRDRLLFAIKRSVDSMLAKLAHRCRAVAALALTFKLSRAEPPVHKEQIRPAEPTLDSRSLLRLIHLRLEGQPLPAGVNEIHIAAEEVEATHEQLQLFASKPRRDLAAANEAIAQLRAEFGNESVLRAKVREGHLPEARFAWEVLDEVRLPEPSPPPDGKRPLVRRIYSRPFQLPPQEHRFRDDGWILGDFDRGPVTNVIGPYIVSGGWWAGEVHREYHFAETRRGDCLWVYYDRRRRRWFLHGEVE